MPKAKNTVSKLNEQDYFREAVKYLLDDFGINPTTVADRFGYRRPNGEIRSDIVTDLLNGSRAFQASHVRKLIAMFRSVAVPSRSLRSSARVKRPEAGLKGRFSETQAASSKAPLPPRVWGVSDEYRLLWLFVHDQEPDFITKETDDEFQNRERFNLGGHVQNAIIVHFAPQKYIRSDINCSFARGPLQTPNENDENAAFQREIINAKEVISNTPNMHNGRGYALTSLSSSRREGGHDGEQPTLEMRFKKSDYIRKRAARALFSSPLMNDKRKKILSDIFTNDVNERYSGGFGAVISIITGDDKLLFFQRSLNVAGDMGDFDCTVTEGADEKDVDEHGCPSPYRNALRALAQEASISGLEDDIQHRLDFHAVICRSTFYDWAIYGSLDLRDTNLTAEELGRKAEQFWRKKNPKKTISLKYDSTILGTTFQLAKDAFEFQKYAAVNFNVRDVVRFICTNPVADYAFVNAILTLRVDLNVSAAAIANELRQYQPFKKS